jgi:hypothetical protein
MLPYIRNNGIVALVFFLVWFLVNLLHMSVPLLLAVGVLVILALCFFAATLHALHTRSRRAIALSLASAALWWTITLFLSTNLLVMVFGLRFR